MNPVSPRSTPVGLGSRFHERHDMLNNIAKLEIEPSDVYGTGRSVELRFGLVLFPFRWNHLASQRLCHHESVQAENAMR